MWYLPGKLSIWNSMRRRIRTSIYGIVLKCGRTLHQWSTCPERLGLVYIDAGFLEVRREISK